MNPLTVNIPSAKVIETLMTARQLLNDPKTIRAIRACNSPPIPRDHRYVFRIGRTMVIDLDRIILCEIMNSDSERQRFDIELANIYCITYEYAAQLNDNIYVFHDYSALISVMHALYYGNFE